jgi:hypothetical protein
MDGIGPIDPALARDMIRGLAPNPKTSWCFTVTDEHGHAIGHGCARPEPRRHTRRREKNHPTPSRDGPGYSFTRIGKDGPPGGYGTWRLTTGIPGQRPMLVTLDPIPVDTCDHRYEAAGHDPGVKRPRAPPQAASPAGTSTSPPPAPSEATPSGRSYTTEPTRYPI